MRIASLTLFVGFFLVGVGCATDADGPEPGDVGGDGKADGSSAGDHRLPGFGETMLVGNSEGKLAVLEVGDRFIGTPVATRAKHEPLVVRTDGTKFYLLYASGSLAIVDPEQAKVERTLRLPSGPADFEWATSSTVLVSRKRAGTIVEVDLATGTTGRTIDLAPVRLPGGTIEPRRLARVGDHLFVQVARRRSGGMPDRGAVAVVDLTRWTIAKVIELQLTDGARTIAGLDPDFDMVFDAARDLLLVTARGNRPADTGMLIRIDVNTLAIHDVQRANSGFQGAVAMGAPFSTLFIMYHTSTPTSSSHLFAYDVATDGAMSSRGGTLVDAFDELDALAINDAGTLAVMANACFAGICPRGEGLNFVDARTRTVLPKLMAAEIGFAPTLVAFR